MWRYTMTNTNPRERQDERTTGGKMLLSFADALFVICSLFSNCKACGNTLSNYPRPRPPVWCADGFSRWISNERPVSLLEGHFYTAWQIIEIDTRGRADKTEKGMWGIRRIEKNKKARTQVGEETVEETWTDRSTLATRWRKVMNRGRESKRDSVNEKPTLNHFTQTVISWVRVN